MNLWLVCFATFFGYVCSVHQETFGYCEQNDTACMSAWLQCHGKQPEGDGWLLLRMFWLGKMTIFNQCLSKVDETTIPPGIPEEDPDGGAPPASIIGTPSASGTPTDPYDRFMGVIKIRLNQIKDLTLTENVACCYSQGSEFIDRDQILISKTFSDLINQRFHSEPHIKNAHLTALETCKSLLITQCNLVPFRDCMYTSCIDQMMNAAPIQ